MAAKFKGRVHLCYYHTYATVSWVRGSRSTIKGDEPYGLMYDKMARRGLRSEVIVVHATVAGVFPVARQWGAAIVDSSTGSVWVIL